MASQAERLRESACYTQSDMSCITCHNPHVSVEETSIATFNSKCQNCHNGAGKKSECTEDMATRNKQDDNCSGCHMPKSGSIDIPHVSITDHHIKTRHDKDQENISYTEAQKIQQFVGLKCMTKENPSSYEMAMGYLSFYEEFSKGRYLLDSAKIFIEQRPQGDLVPWLKPIVKYHFLRNDFASIRTYASCVRLDSVQDEWTNYRIGEAYFQAKQYQKALKYYQQAVNKKPFNLAFQNKLGSTYFQLGNYQKAERVFRLILTEDPRHKEAMANLGYLLLRKGRKERASDYFKKTLSLDPDYLQAMFNQAALTLQNKQWDKARTILQNILTKDPGNSKAQQLLQRLDAMERKS
jgi:predicted Zn-dependent protease